MSQQSLFSIKILFSAEFNEVGFGTFDSPHPYGRNENYIFNIEHTGTLKWMFHQFEVDKLDDGTCSDEIWILKHCSQI
jgi:hypothetical protein